MNIQEFICKYQEAFGENTPLPIAFGYHHKAAEEVKKIPRCMIGAIRKVCDGKPLTLSADNVLCGAEKPYLNFIRIDQLESLEEMEGILFFATPDVLSGLCSWAFYDNNDNDAVCTRFASGCCSIVTFATKENAAGGRRCFIGMLDPSARPLIPKNELRFKEMLDTMEQSALFQKAYSIVRKRINGEIQKEAE